MTILFGTGQTNGAPLVITALTLGTAQTVHTAPAGAATPNLIDLFASNSSDVGVLLTIALFDSGATLIRSFSLMIGAKSFNQPVLDQGDIEAELILNGTITVRAFAATASVLTVAVRVDNQSTTTGTVSDNFASGLVAAVQNANRFAFPAPQGGVGTATEANANQMIARAGILRNLSAKADANIGGGATVTVGIRVNGVTVVSIPLTVTETTVLQTSTVSVPVVPGDLVTFIVSCDNAGAPAANFHAACEYVAQ